MTAVRSVRAPSSAALADARQRENFPVAPRLLPRRRRRTLLGLYAFARLVDDIGDEPGPGGRPRPPAEVRADLAAVDEDITRAAAGEPTRLPTLADLPSVLAACGLGREPFDDLVLANLADQEVTDYGTRVDLIRYCSLSAAPVGRLVLGAFSVDPTPGQLRCSDEVCAALQVLEHLQDVGEDARRGRVYLPREDRERFGVSRAMLTAPQATPEVRALVADEAGWAARLLHRGSALVGSLRPGTARLAVAGYVAGGHAALRALGRAGWDPLGTETVPRRGDVVAGFAALVTTGRLA